MEKYSVLMAVYYKEKPEYLRLAIDSMLAQTMEPDEFLLVCDGPLSPELDAVIADYSARFPELFCILRLAENQGLGAALNAGLRQCRNELIARMDSDDLAVPERMEWQLEEMKKHPEVSVLGGQIGEFWEDPERIVSYRTVPVEEPKIREFLKYRSPMNHTTVLLRRSHILQIGNYQPLSGFEDYTLWIRLIAGGYHLRNMEAMCCRVRADRGMYARRGGVRYFCNALKMEQLLLKKRLISPWQFRKNVFVRFVGTILVPPGLRRSLFLHFLRTREPKRKIAEHQCRLRIAPAEEKRICYCPEAAGRTCAEP